jgi:hypothetical protein
MAEWSIAHAWKSTLRARADALQIPPMHFPFNNFRNSDINRRIPATDALFQGFRGVCDTVLTQEPTEVTPYDSVCTDARQLQDPCSASPDGGNGETLLRRSTCQDCSCQKHR